MTAIRARAADPVAVERAWDLYAADSYEQLLQLNAGPSAELNDLQSLARLELAATPLDIEARDSLFAGLLLGMQAYHRGDRQSSARALGRWLADRDYACTRVVERFCEMALLGEEHGLLDQAARKWLKHGALGPLLARALLQSLMIRGRFAEAARFFERMRAHLADAESAQRAALAYLQLSRYQDAQQLLYPLYERVHGQPYQDRYDEVRRSYAAAINEAEQILSQSGRPRQASMQLGLSLLFAERYKEALQIFEELQTSAA
ncbi:MAG: hypothetical protein K1X75_03320 [Leptospirales bacterium]|nr:hypothetical protein [Leptospirales bacterium]